MKFLRKNWLKIIIVIAVVLFIIDYLDGKLSEKQYKENIENLEVDVQRLRANNKTIKSINNDLRTVRAKDKAADV